MKHLKFGNQFGGVLVPRCPICQSAKEKIRWIPGREEKYAATTNGKIVSYRRKKPKVLSIDGSHEYARVRFGSRENCIVAHKVVASTYRDLIPNWNGDHIDWDRFEIDHHDCDKKHNCVANLRVVPKGSQVALNYVKGERNQKLTPGDMKAIQDFRSKGVSVKRLARYYHVSTTRIYQITSMPD